MTATNRPFAEIRSRLRALAKRQAALDVEAAKLNSDGGHAIRSWRLANAVTLRTMAKRLAISAAYLCDAELGRRSIAPILQRLQRESD